MANTNNGSVCPITHDKIKNLNERRRFGVKSQNGKCITYYDIEALYEWTVNRKKKILPHTGGPMADSVIKEISAAYKAWLKYIVETVYTLIENELRNPIAYEDEDEDTNEGFCVSIKDEATESDELIEDTPTILLIKPVLGFRLNTNKNLELVMEVKFTRNKNDTVWDWVRKNHPETYEEQKEYHDRTSFFAYINVDIVTEQEVPEFRNPSIDLFFTKENALKEMEKIDKPLLSGDPKWIFSSTAVAGGSKNKKKYTKTSQIHTGRDGIRRVVYTSNGKSYVKRQSKQTGKYEYKIVH